ncbi:hypothetical protein [Pedobacter sp.]|uniref:hypothetical protein n=1 Tax=Pedobacter sp. TaxID=1411316 RepID=UPI00396CF3FE
MTDKSKMENRENLSFSSGKVQTLPLLLAVSTVKPSFTATVVSEPLKPGRLC